MTFPRQVGKDNLEIYRRNNLTGSLVWVSVCVSSLAPEALSATVTSLCEVACNPYGLLLAWRNAGSPAEQESQLHRERKGTKSLDSISSSKRVGKVKGEGGRTPAAVV